MKRREGCIYSEMTNPGLCGYRRVKGVGLVPVKKFRYVAELSYHGCRFRFRSTNIGNCRLWLDKMLTLYGED